MVEIDPYEPDHPLITEPMGTVQPHNRAFEYNFKDVPQKHCGGREIYEAGGKLLSGSSAVLKALLLTSLSHDALKQVC